MSASEIMTTSYLLPCVCGRKIPVDAGQSGLIVKCACGADLTVPTMRGLATLERATSAPLGNPVASREWGTAQGLIFLGTVLVLASVVAASVLWAKWPKGLQINEEFITSNRKDMESMSIAQTFEVWENLRVGLDQQRELPMMVQFLEQEATFRQRMIGAAVVGGFGAALTMMGLVIGSSRKGAGMR